MVVYERVALFELGVACDIFGDTMAAQLGVPWYRLSVCAATPQVMTDAGFPIVVPCGLDAVRTAGTVIVPPTEAPEAVPEAVLDALREASEQGRRLVSLCTGALVLAAAGVLDGTARLAFLALGLTLPGLLLQDSWRFSFFALGHGGHAFLNDTIWTIVLLPALVILRKTGHANVFWFVIAWGATAAAAAASCRSASHCRY